MRELKNNDAVQLFEDKKVRTAWDEEKEECVMVKRFCNTCG